MAKDSTLQFKGTTLKIIQTQLRTTDTNALHAALGELTGNAPDFFEHELSVLDFTGADALNAPADWPGIIALLRQSGLQPVATRGLPDELATAAAVAGLAVVPADALPSRFEAARMAAVQLLKPNVVHLSLPKRTLNNTEELKAWLADVEQLVAEKLKQGPVAL